MVRIPFEISSVSGTINSIFNDTFSGNRQAHLFLQCCLADLKVLSLRSCPLVSSECILSSVRFPFLQRFDYIAARKVRSSFVVRILSQNPSLKSLAVNFETTEEKVMREECNNKLRPVKLMNLVIYFNAFIPMLQLRHMSNNNSNMTFRVTGSVETTLIVTLSPRTLNTGMTVTRATTMTRKAKAVATVKEIATMTTVTRKPSHLKVSRNHAYSFVST